VAFTDDGDTLSYTDDADGDGIADGFDNCPWTSNRDQKDTDGDGRGDACDNCPTVSNRDQRNTNGAKWPNGSQSAGMDMTGRGMGDACNPDIDGDGIPNAADNCPTVYNPGQENSYNATLGDACNPDIDGDGIPNSIDICPRCPNPSQNPAEIITGPDGKPTIAGCRFPCSTGDKDHDGVADEGDNCPETYNPDQKVTYRYSPNQPGDACNNDWDGDGVENSKDNCPYVPNPDQRNSTGKHQGDECDTEKTKFNAGVREANGEVLNGDLMDINSALQVSGGGKYKVPNGTAKLRLPLWANRNGMALEYTYEVKTSPHGNASVQNARGFVSQSVQYQYVFPAGNEPTIMLEAGHYDLVLGIRNVGAPDRAYPDISTANAAISIDVEDTPTKKGGCAAIPAATPVVGFAIALFALLRRRRQPK
jgi:hypothetical protein